MTKAASSVDDLDEQVLHILIEPDNHQNTGERPSPSRLARFSATQDLDSKTRRKSGPDIERMDMRWDHGFITDEHEFLQQRMKLQQEMEQLTPVDNNDLERAVDLLTNFASHWEACGDDIEAQSAFIKQIVERVYVRGSAGGGDDIAVQLSSGSGA